MTKKAKKRRPVTISTKTAITRLDTMMLPIRREIADANRIVAALEAGNDVVGTMKDRNIQGAASYNTIDAALVLNSRCILLGFSMQDRGPGLRTRATSHPSRLWSGSCDRSDAKRLQRSEREKHQMRLAESAFSNRTALLPPNAHRKSTPKRSRVLVVQARKQSDRHETPTWRTH